MLKCLLTGIAFILFQTVVFGQDQSYQRLIDSITKHAGLFIGIQPITKLRLSITDTSLYMQHLEALAHYKLDSKILKELIRNSRNADTTYWTDKELKAFILVKSRNEHVSLKEALAKLKTAGEQQIKLYSKQINEFNNTGAWDRNILYFSRPVFDNTKHFAIVQFNNGHGGSGGGGSISLFHLDGKAWTEIGDIADWKY